MRRESGRFFFDGGCAPNPGPMQAAVVSQGRAWFRDGPGIGDNSQAEWLALLFAVELAVAAGVIDAVFLGDSALVVAQASRRQRCRSVQLQPYLAAYEAAIVPLGRVRLRHVPRTRNLAGIALAKRGLIGSPAIVLSENIDLI